MCSLLHSLVEYELHIALYGQAAAHCQSLVGSQRVAHLQCGTAVQCHLACQCTLTSQCSAALHCHCTCARVCAVYDECTGSNGGCSSIVAVTSESPVACTHFLYACLTHLGVMRLVVVVYYTVEILVGVCTTYYPSTRTSIPHIEA